MNPASLNDPAVESAASESWIESLRALPQPVWVVFVGSFINRIGTFVIPFLTLHVSKLGVPDSQVGVPLALYGVGALFASVFGGHLADSIGRRNTISLSMFSSAVTMVGLAFCSTAAQIWIMAGVAGFATELYRPASSALLADLVPESRRVMAFAGYRWFINAGWAVGPILGGYLAAHSYFLLFICDAMTALIYGAMAWFLLPQLRVGARPGLGVLSRAIPDMAKAMKVAFSVLPFARFWLANFCIALVFTQMSATLGLETQEAGFDERFYGLVLALNGILIVFIELPVSGLTRRFPPESTIATGFLLMGLGFGGLAWWTTAPGFFICMTVFTIGEMIGLPVAMAYVAKLAPQELRGRYMGVFGLSFTIALAVAPSVGVWVRNSVGSPFWLGVGALGVTGAMLMWWPVTPDPGA